MKNQYIIWITAILIFLAAASSSAQENGTEPSAGADLEFRDIQCVDSNGKPRQKNRLGPKGICRIGDRVETTVTGLGDWIAGEKSKLDTLVLALDGQMLTGLTAGQPAKKL